MSVRPSVENATELAAAACPNCGRISVPRPAAMKPAACLHPRLHLPVHLLVAQAECFLSAVQLSPLVCARRGKRFLCFAVASLHKCFNILHQSRFVIRQRWRRQQRASACQVEANHNLDRIHFPHRCPPLTSSPLRYLIIDRGVGPRISGHRGRAIRLGVEVPPAREMGSTFVATHT